MHVSMRQPEVLVADAGHPFFTLGSLEFPGLLGSLRGKMLPPDKGPYADNANGDISRMAKQMWRTGKGGPAELEEKAKWLIDILLPRAVMDPEGNFHMVPIPDQRSFGDLRMVLDEMPLACRNDDAVITAGRLLQQPRIGYAGNDYLPIMHTEEPPLVAVAAMRALQMEAYMSLLFSPDMEHGGVAIHEGIAVFPDETTLLSFNISLSRTHLPIMGISVLSDPMVMATQWLRCADQVMRMELIHLDDNVARGLINDESVDTTIQLIKAKAAMASFLSSGEHAELEPFLAKAHGARLDWKALLTHHTVGMRLDNLVAQLDRRGLAPRVADGIKPGDVSAYLKRLVSVVAAGYYKCSADNEYVMACHSMLDQFIRGMPGRYGFPVAEAQSLLGYMQAEFAANANSAAIPARIVAADSAEWTVILAGTYLKQLRSDFGEVEEALKAGSIERDAAVARVKSIVDKHAEGARRLGFEQELIITGKGELEAFITQTLPRHKILSPAVAELSAYAAGKFDPKSPENLDYEAERVETDILRSIAALNVRLATRQGAMPLQMVAMIETEAKNLIDILADGANRFGRANPRMVNADGRVKDFVRVILPKHGVPAGTIREIMRYGREKLSPRAPAGG